MNGFWDEHARRAREALVDGIVGKNDKGKRFMSNEMDKMSPAQIAEQIKEVTASAVPPAPKVHVGVGAMVEKSDSNIRRSPVPLVLPASRRCLATIPENLNDMWWRDAKVDKPVDRELVLFHTSTGFIYTGARLPAMGVFIWSDGHVQMSDAEVTHWMPQPSKPK
jgi:hypothetical protein